MPSKNNRITSYNVCYTKLLRKKLCFFFILMLTVMACKVKRPDGVIAESQMEELLYDYHLARSMGEIV